MKTEAMISDIYLSDTSAKQPTTTLEKEKQHMAHPSIEHTM